MCWIRENTQTIRMASEAAEVAWLGRRSIAVLSMFIQVKQSEAADTRSKSHSARVGDAMCQCSGNSVSQEVNWLVEPSASADTT